jgi:hypothetical protein
LLINKFVSLPTSYFDQMTTARIIPLVMAGFLAFTGPQLSAQRTYTAHSALSSGNWYKISVNSPGIYKIDLPFLSSLGVNTASLGSASLRLFGNGGQMLPENPAIPVPDDLLENALWVEDGGDGIINGNDYILFYAPGPHPWIKDSINKSFRHQKNIYSEQSYYYLTIGGTGKRVNTVNPALSPNFTITGFNERYFYELDTFNFLSSGRQWFGEEFSDAPGKQTSRTYILPVTGVAGSPGTIKTNCAARSFGTASRFTMRINGQPAGAFDIPPAAPGVYDLFAREVQSTAPFVSNQAGLTVSFDYTTGSFNSQGWLDWFEIHVRRSLSMGGVNQLLFRDWNSTGPGNSGQFIIKEASAATQVWDVTRPQDAVRMQALLSGSDLRFVNDCAYLHEYIAFNNTGFLLPKAEGRVPNQDLHNSVLTDFLIVTHPVLQGQAQRLATYHQQRDNLRTLVITTGQVYNEFSSGTPDPVAIRDFVKMYYDKAGGDSTKRPRYLLLLGDASFDYKSRITNNTNLVPAWESPVSLDPLSTYTSDDFFGFLDNGDDISGNGTYLLDIGIGRIPAKNETEAKAIIDKIMAYNGPGGFGPWRNEMTFVADDEDNNLHLQDAEIITDAVEATTPLVNIDKIYLDAFQQESSSGGSRYPEVNKAINNKMFNGTLIWNYNGHGGYRRLAEEVVLDQAIINTLNNAGKLPLFVTATCDFAPFDNPLVSAIGENLLLREKTGAIALMTTTRLVFAFSNRVMNENYLRTALQKQANGSYLSLGEAVRRAKNHTYTFFGDVVNNRKFTLLGDPAFTLGYPTLQVKTTAINTKPLTTVPDTLKALSEYAISGTVEDHAGNQLTQFNGTLHVTLFDKVQTTQTLGNDPGSLQVPFKEQKNILFKGKASVVNGAFTFSFVVPGDINYQFGNGKISYYADDGKTDGNGAFSDIIVGGSGNGLTDQEGPLIQPWLNDEKFVNGSITNDRPLLIIKLADSSGINIMGTGIGHDLMAILDNDQKQSFVLNEFYESELDNFRKGLVRFQLPALAEGTHTLTIKAWDIANNSNQASIDFRVIKQENFSLDHVLNYPNPFTTHTTFWFGHNRPGEALKVSVEVYTVTGKLVKTIRKAIFSPGNRSSEVEWDGRDDYGSKIGRGVYIYRLRVQTSDGKAAEKLEKLFIL